MKTTAKMKINISNARIINANTKVMHDGTCNIELELEMIAKKQQRHDGDCILVRASELSLNDDFMKYKPNTDAEKRFKIMLSEVIKDGIENFYRPIMDPSFADEGNTKIHYVAHEKPAVGKSYNWWKKTVKNSKWCLGTKDQYVAFMGVLIKELIAEGWKDDEAWHAVCNDSRILGNYCNSENAKHKLEDTGSRERCGFYDLANTYKILAKDKKTDEFFLAGGMYKNYGFSHPLVGFETCKDCDNDYINSVAWLVLKD